MLLHPLPRLVQKSAQAGTTTQRRESSLRPAAAMGRAPMHGLLSGRLTVGQADPHALPLVRLRSLTIGASFCLLEKMLPHQMLK